MEHASRTIGDPTKVSMLVAQQVEQLESTERYWKQQTKELKKKQKQEYIEFVMNFYAIESQRITESPNIDEERRPKEEMKPKEEPPRSTQTPPSPVTPLRKEKDSPASFRRKVTPFFRKKKQENPRMRYMWVLKLLL